MSMLSLPTFVVNAASTKQPLVIANIRDWILANPNLVKRLPEFGAPAKATSITANGGITGVSSTAAAAVAAPASPQDEIPDNKMIVWDESERSHELVTRFRSITNGQHWKLSLSLLSTLIRDYYSPKPDTPLPDPLLVGVLQIRLVRARGRIFSEGLRLSNIRCRVTFGNERRRTDKAGVKWDQDFAFPVYNPASLLTLTIVTEEKDGTYLVGQSSFSLAELSAKGTNVTIIYIFLSYREWIVLV
jgi:hypothetical protein